ncbi:MAG: alpha/beta hydrolase [Acidobacteria bacterium]|nr:alpha/beta hydrolase [Acidobacteriota bacterium]
MQPHADAILPEKIFHTTVVDLNYAERSGNRPAIVFLHGIGRTWRDFLPLIPAFAESQVYALDLRGHGKSGRVANAYASGDYAADVIAFLKHNLDRPAVILGHSLGGMIALRVAAEVPKLVRAIIVGDTVLCRDSLASSMYQELFVGLYEIVMTRAPGQQLAKRLAQVQVRVPGLEEPVGLGELLGNRTDLQEWADCLEMLDPAALRAIIDASTFKDFDCEGVLKRIHCPVLILQANPQLGGLMSEEALEKVQRHLPHVEVARFRLLGHALHLGRAQPVIEAVEKFMAAISI